MPSSSSRFDLKSVALALSFIALQLGAGAAHAQSPRLWAREVSADYDMQDGSTVRIALVGRRVQVESPSAESPSAEFWTALSSDLLVSPDGLRRIRLLRDFDGTVDRIELQTYGAPPSAAAGQTRQAAVAAPPTGH